MSFRDYNFNDVVRYRRISSPKQLRQCSAVTYDYMPEGKYMHIHTPNNGIINAKNGTMLKSYGTPILFLGVDEHNNTFVIFFPYCEDGKCSATTWYHIRKFCEDTNIPVINSFYLRNPEVYEHDTDIAVIKWW